MSQKLNGLVIYTGNPNWDLPKKICKELGLKLGIINYTVTPDEEQLVRFEKSVRGKHLVIINENTPPDKLIQCTQMIDAAQRSDTEKITLCNPYFGWLRQDRQTKGKEAINAKIVVNFLISDPPKVRGALSMDNHFPQSTSLTDKPWDHIYAASYFIDWIKKLNKRGTVISPDIGGIGTVRYCANRLGFPMGFMRKIRKNDKKTEVTEIIRNDKEKIAFIIDDIAATFDSAEGAIKALLKNGVKKIYFLCTHPVLAGNAIKNINNLPVAKIIATNTVHVPKTKKRNCPKLQIISVHKIFAKAIKNIHLNKSVSELYDSDLPVYH